MSPFNFKPLFSLGRGDATEIIVHGAAVFVSEDRSSDHPFCNTMLPSRSTLKPWQFLAADSFDEEDFWAIGLSSHSGEGIHLQALDQIMDRFKIDPKHLVCPLVYPVSEIDACRLKVENAPRSRLYHPCSGKHLTMLAACAREGLEHNYDSSDHPIQVRLRKMVHELSGKEQRWLTDSCGLPTLYAPIATHQNMWMTMARSVEPRIALLKHLWTQNPQLVGGTTRFDTMLVKVGEGHTLAKDGADGILTLQTLPEKEEPVQNVFVKIVTGYNPSYLGLALENVLRQNMGQLNSAMRRVLSFLEKTSTSRYARDQFINFHSDLDEKH